MLKNYVYNNSYKRIPGSGNFYEIDCSGNVRETIGKKPVDLVMNSSGQLVFPALPFEWFSGVTLAVVLAVTHRNITIPERHWATLELIYKDGDITNYRLTNTVWKCPNGNLTHPLLPGFCYIPGFSRYLISKDGIVISVKKGEPLVPYYDDNRYLMFGVQPDVGHRTIVGMHRLLALAYIDYPGNVDSLDVNHLDTVKSNNDLTNLEWATRSRNNFHAQENGLMNSKPVLVRNIVTGEVIRFYSIEETARELKLDGETVRIRLSSSKSGKVYSGLYQFKYESDKTPWIEYTNLGDYTHVNLRKEVVIQNASGDEVVFKSVKTAAAHLGKMTGELSFLLNTALEDTIVVDGHVVKFA